MSETYSRRGKEERNIRRNQAMKEESDGEGKRQELVDSCCFVYFEDIALLQMFSSTQRKRGDRGGQGRRRETVTEGCE